MPGRRRGARTGRGWDAAPARSRPARPSARSRGDDSPDDDRWAGDPGDAPLWFGEEESFSRPERPPGDPADEPAGRSGESRGKPEQAPAELAREICLRQLAVRPRTRAELATALRKQGIADEVADEVLDRYDEVGIIDDAAFARAWVTSRHHGRGLSRRALASELRQKGVNGELVGEALTEVDGDTEAATARSLVDRKLRSMSSAAPDAAFRRLVGMLARKGYPPGLAVRVVKDALADRDAEAAAFADLVDPDVMPGLVGDSDDPIR